MANQTYMSDDDELDDPEWDESEADVCGECGGSGSLSTVMGDIAMSMDCPACGGYGYEI